MQKRTARIDAEREVLVTPEGPNGVPVFTTAGQIALSPTEKEQLHSKLGNAAHEGRVTKAIALIEENAAKFAATVFEKIAPASVNEASYHIEDVVQHAIFRTWVKENRFQVIQDGLTTYVKAKGEIVAQMTAKMEDFLPEVRQAVEERLRKRRT